MRALGLPLTLRLLLALRLLGRALTRFGLTAGLLALAVLRLLTLGLLTLTRFSLLALARLGLGAFSLSALLAFGLLLTLAGGGLRLLAPVGLRAVLRLTKLLTLFALAGGLLLLRTLARGLSLFTLTRLGLLPLRLAPLAFRLLTLTLLRLFLPIGLLLALRLPLLTLGLLALTLGLLLLAIVLARILPARALLLRPLLALTLGELLLPLALGDRALAFGLTALLGTRHRTLALGLCALLDQAILADLGTLGDLLQLRAAALETALLPGVEALRLDPAELALVAPMRLLPFGDAAVIALPAGLARTGLFPAAAILGERLAPFRPA